MGCPVGKGKRRPVAARLHGSLLTNLIPVGARHLCRFTVCIARDPRTNRQRPHMWEMNCTAEAGRAVRSRNQSRRDELLRVPNIRALQELGPPKKARRPTIAQGQSGLDNAERLGLRPVCVPRTGRQSSAALGLAACARESARGLAQSKSWRTVGSACIFGLCRASPHQERICAKMTDF